MTADIFAVKDKTGFIFAAKEKREDCEKWIAEEGPHVDHDGNYKITPYKRHVAAEASK